MSSNSSGGIFGENNRLWSLPMLFGGAACGVFFARHASGGGIQCAVETAVAAGVGFLIAVGVNAASGGKEKAPNPKSRRGQQEILEMQRREIHDLKHEMSKLEDNMASYLKERTAEGHRMRATIVDMGSDIRKLRETDHTAELRPQLAAINEKFGELQGVRQIVAALTVKMRMVDTLAAQIQDAEQRFAGQVQQGSVAMLERLKGEVAVLREDLAGALTNQLTGMVDEKVTQCVDESVERSVDRKVLPVVAAEVESKARAAQKQLDMEAVIAQLQANLESLVEVRMKVVAAAGVAVGAGAAGGVAAGGSDMAGGFRVLTGGAGMTSGEFAAVAAAEGSGADASKMETLERRIQKMSGTIESLRTTIQDLKFSGGASEDKGIPSIYRKAAGLDLTKPGAEKKSGALAKMFQDNMKLKQAVKAA